MIVPTYFASGSNRPAEIRGFARIGQDIGVAVPELSENAILELEALAGTGIKVFVDSGAFSEVDFGAFGRKVVAPISDVEWNRRLAVYARLGLVLGSQLYVVAPDSVGDQAETLERLSRFADTVRAIRSTGANVLVAIQKGAKSQAAFVADCAAILGFDDFIHALPCKKSATSPQEIADYVASAQPAELHLLGMGIRNRALKRILESIAKLSPRTVVSCDSCLIRNSTGLTNGPKGGPRVLTRCTAVAKSLIAAGRSAIQDAKELAIVLAFSDRSASFQAVAAARLAAA